MNKSNNDKLKDSESKDKDLKDNDQDFTIEFNPNVVQNKNDTKISIPIEDNINKKKEEENKDTLTSEEKALKDYEPYSFDYSRLNKDNDEYLNRGNTSYFKRVFNGRNSIIIAIVAIAFIILNIYRLNDPLELGATAPNLTFISKNGDKFDLDKIYSSKVLIFYKKHTYFSNYIFNTTYKRALPAFKILQDKGLAQVIVISKGYDSPEELSELLALDDYSSLENIMFATDTDLAGKEYGIRSWPHLYVLSKDNKVIYETKIGSADKVQQILWRDF